MFLIQQGLIDKLDQLDKWLFIQVNYYGSNGLFDATMPYVRNSFYWAPLYIFLFFFATLNFRGKGWWWVVFFMCTVSLTDMTSSQLIKEIFKRPRPCADPEFYQYVRLLLSHCSGKYSFTSSHAANHFGMAVFMFITLKPVIKNWVWLGIAWAALIAYAQVYVGVHYPFDVLGGTIIGLMFGWILGSFFNKRFGFANFD